jgi:hypothetical protein
MKSMAGPQVSQGQIDEILKQEPNADAFADKMVMFGVAAIVFCLLLSWMAPKMSAVKTLLHWMGAH